MCAQDEEIQKDRLSVYKRGCPSHFVASPGLLTEYCALSDTMPCIWANRFHFTELVYLTNSGLEHPA